EEMVDVVDGTLERCVDREVVSGKGVVVVVEGRVVGMGGEVREKKGGMEEGVWEKWGKGWEEGEGDEGEGDGGGVGDHDAKRGEEWVGGGGEGVGGEVDEVVGGGDEEEVGVVV
ncbi:hypothetical protein, partial [Kocuria salsicia]|uniref:hypothetical protein n=1 Tax=Kocuria salsicia TaxID=664639 RepID=UPI001C92C438